MPGLKGDIKKVESVQSKFTRFLCKRLNISYNNYEHRLTKLNLETLEIRRVKSDLILIYKIFNKLIDLNFNDFFTLDQTHLFYNLRKHKLSIQIPKLCKTSVRNNFFNYRCTKIWNGLPEEVVTSVSLSIFKNKLNKINLYNLYTSKL